MTSNTFATIIGLEVHVQLSTQTKLFCGCRTEFGAAPNTHVCPVCLGLPGALPVLNRKAVELAAIAGLALHCRVAEFTKWDRKNYFYPDLPKGYQISQYDLPICADGFLEFDASADNQVKRVRILRAHLEEDAGKSMHDESLGIADSRIDLNRAGTPLLEIVTQPDLTSSSDTKDFLNELKLMLTNLGVSDCNMQEGSLRVDANVNIEIVEGNRMITTPITEIKNLNSFRAVERAIDYEAQRQYDQWKADGRVKGESPKQTRGWNDDRGITEPQREKEESADYRYFPDPDLVAIRLSSETLQALEKKVGESPRTLRRRYETQYDLKPYDADVIVNQGRAFCDYFEASILAGAPPKRASAWLQQDVLRSLKDRSETIENFPIAPRRFGELLKAVESGMLDTARARLVFQRWFVVAEESLEQSIEALGFSSVSTDELEAICRDVLKELPDVIAKVKQGNTKVLGSVVGHAKKRNPNGDPRLIQELCLKMIETEF